MDNNRYLLQAIRLGNVDILERLLALNVCSPDCHAVDYLSTPALVLCINGVKTPSGCDLVESEALRCTLVRILLRHSAHLEATDKDSMTAALYAAELGFLECLRVLGAAGADLTRSGRGGRSALMLSAMKGHYACLRYLIEHVPRTYLNHQSNDGDTAVISAVKFGETQCLQLLLTAGADINIRDKAGYSALMHALCRRNDSALRLLLCGGAHINIVAHDGKTSLTIAFRSAYLNFTPIIKLLELGADMTLSQEDQHFLHEMIVRDQKDIVRGMVMNGCAPLERKCKEHFFPFSLPLKPLSPLAVALLTKRPDIARYFLANHFLTRYDIVELCWDPDIRQSLEQSSSGISGNANEEEGTPRKQSLEIINNLAIQPRSLFTHALVLLSSVLHEASFPPPPKRCAAHPSSLGALLSRLAVSHSRDRSSSSNGRRQNIGLAPTQTTKMTRRERIERLQLPVPLKRALLFQSSSTRLS